MMRELIVALVFVVACNSDKEGKAVVAKFQDFAKQMCACKDKACADKVNAELDAYSDSGAIKKPSDEQMRDVVKAEGDARDCAKKFDDLEALRTNLEDARKKSATGDSMSVSAACSMFRYEQFMKDNAELAKQPEVAKFLAEYKSYCSVGAYVEMATKDIEAAEAEKAANASARPATCTSMALTTLELNGAKDPEAAKAASPLKARLEKVCGS